MSASHPVIAVTLGEPAGVGPDLAAVLALRDHAGELVLIGDREVLAARVRQLHLPLQLTDYTGPDHAAAAGTARVLHVATAQPVRAGELDVANAPHVLSMLRRALQGCRRGEFDAMLTLPVHKGVINDAGFAFTGHTEFLAQECAVALPVMMLVTEGLRVALATTHLPLHAVPGAITRELLIEVITVLHGDLQRRFGIAMPHIVVTGLNPHAGEQGHLGLEETAVIEPVLSELRAQGMRLTGPLPADTAFIPKYMHGADAFLAMYHDQGLPVLKYLGFGRAANITLGLPVIRTSVDHGTALDIAGSGVADVGSAAYTLDLTRELIAQGR